MVNFPCSQKRNRIMLKITFCLLAALLPLAIQTDVKSHNENIACFDLMDGNTSYVGHNPSSCVVTSNGSIYSVLFNMIDHESMQILTFSSKRNFNLIKTRVLFSVNQNGKPRDEYIGLETTTRFEKKGRMIVLSRSLVKRLNETGERRDREERIKLITSRENKGSGYIYHIYDVDRVTLSNPDIDLLHNRTILWISLDAQEILTSAKQHHFATSPPAYLFGEGSDDRPLLLVTPAGAPIATHGHWGPSLSPVFITALIVFAAVLLLSCFVASHIPGTRKIVHD